MTEMESWEHYAELDDINVFHDEPQDEGEIVNINLLIDASKLTDKEFDEIMNRVEEIGYSKDDFQNLADFQIEYVWKDSEDDATSFTISGWCYEYLYNELWDCLKDYNVEVYETA